MLVVAHQLFSFLWYSPYLFGYRWVHASGFRFSDFPPINDMAFYWPFVFSIIASVLLCYAITFLFSRFNIVKTKEALKWSFILWFVFLFLNLMTHNLFAQRPIALTLIDGGRDCLIFLSTGFVISTFIVRKSK